MKRMTDLSTILDKCQILLEKFPESKTMTPNERLFFYWKYWNQFGDVTLDPNCIDNYHSIDRAFRRLMPSEYKNYRAEKEYKQVFAKTV